MDNYKEMALMYKAFCDENRLRLIEALTTGEKCACVLLEEVAIAQSTLSHHMKILTESGVVESRKEGKWTYYSLSDHGCANAVTTLGAILKKSDHYPTLNSCERNEASTVIQRF